MYAILKYGAEKANESIKNLGYIIHCFRCFHRETVKAPSLIEHGGRCSKCGSKVDFAGPLWLRKLSEKQFCNLMEREAERRALKNGERIRKILALVKGEVDAPITYYVLDKLCHKLALPAPSVKTLLEVLREKGFQAYLTHFNPKGMRTDAPVMDISGFLQTVVASLKR